MVRPWEAAWSWRWRPRTGSPPTTGGRSSASPKCSWAPSPAPAGPRGPHRAPGGPLGARRRGGEKGREEGYRAEASFFGGLVVGAVPRRLVEIFFAPQALKKDRGVAGGPKPKKVEKIGVLGAGL